MNKRELTQLYFLNKEILNDKKRLKYLKDYKLGKIEDFRTLKISSSFEKNCEIDNEINCLIEKIEYNIKRCWMEINRLNEFINSIEDSEMRLIFALRHIDGLSWQEIAFSIGYCDESTPRKRYERFLKNYK